MEEKISDLVWLGRRLDNMLSLMHRKEPHLVTPFINMIKTYFVPLILNDYLTEEEEDHLFESTDRLLDKLEEKII